MLNDYISIISLIIAAYSLWEMFKLKSKKVDLKYTSNTFPSENSFNTQFHFFNKGNMPATDVKIRLLYPKGTKIMRISPPIKKSESEDNSGKLLELHIQRITSDMPIGFLITSEFEPLDNPEILYHEQKAAQSVARAKLNN